MANFVTIEEDKFEKKTTYVTSQELALDTLLLNWDTKAQLRRVVQMPNLDVMVIDIKSRGRNTVRTCNLDKLIIIVDDETITLQPNTSYSDHDSNLNSRQSCFYELGKEGLLKICNCKSISMKLYTSVEDREVGNANAFAVYCKLFYNAVYDNTAYTDVVSNALEKFTGFSGDISTFNDISLNGSGANGGCMGMIALMLTLGGAAIGGVCSLI